VQTTKFKDVLNFLGSRRRLQKRPNATVYSYSGQRHALSRHDGAHYNAAAAMANGQTSEFQKQQLL
jgi:carboxymethylenebutenolidase